MYSAAEFDVEFDGKHRLPHKIRHSENSTFSTHFLHKSSSPEDRPPSTNIERMSVKSENFPGEAKKKFFKKIKHIFRLRILRRMRWRPPFHSKNSPLRVRALRRRRRRRRRRRPRLPNRPRAPHLCFPHVHLLGTF